MADAGEYKKTLEAYRTFADIANNHEKRYADELSWLSERCDLRRRVLMISKRMAEHCGFFIGMSWDSETVGAFVSQRMAMIRREHVTDGLEDALAALPPDDLGVFALFAHGTWFLHNSFLFRREAEIAAAYENGRPERAFEANVIVETIYGICREWLAWYRENGPVPFEKWTYDVHPSEKYTKGKK